MTYSSSQERFDSTYTYTNAVPQNPSFNNGAWRVAEERIRVYAALVCTKPIQNIHQSAGTLYLLTGTSFKIIQNGPVGVPANIQRIGNNGQEQIAVPNSLWTAGCCVRQNGPTESFAVMGNNVQNENLQLTLGMTVAQLQVILAVNNLNNVVLFPGNPNCINNNINI